MSIFYQNLRVLLQRITLTGVAFLIATIGFLRVVDTLLDRENLTIDISILTWLHKFATPALDRLAIVVTNLGNASTVIVVSGIIGLILLYKKQWQQALFFLASIAGAAATDATLKLIFHRARPSLWSPIISETDYSFPSGHAMITTALTVSLCYLLWNTKWRWLAVGLGAIYVIGVGLSRLYLGVHYPTDIISGWCASTIWVLIVARIAKVNAR